MQLVLDTTGLIVKQKNRSFSVATKTNRRLISPSRIDSIAVTASCLLSSPAIRLAVKNNIPIYFINAAGEVEATVWSPYFTGLASLRQAQGHWINTPDAIDWMVGLALLKTQRQKQLLRSLKILEPIEKLDATMGRLSLLREKKPGDSSNQFDEIRQTLFGLEGTAARFYWTALSNALPEGWQFDGRSRQPAQDPFNAALNYMYGMMYGTVEAAVFAAGLDPFMGVLHAEEYNRPSLTFDCIEPFRPWIDALLVKAFQASQLKSNWFVPKGKGWWLGKKGKAFIIPLFNDFLTHAKTVKRKKTSVKNHIHHFTGTLASRIKATQSTSL